MKQLIDNWRDFQSDIMLEESIEEGNPFHKKSGSSKGGQFTSPTKGDTYSITKKGAKASGISDEYVKKGVYSGRNKDGTAKTHGRFGAADKCGRMDLQGDEISQRYRCDDYKKPYKEAVELEEDEKDVSREYVRSTFANELQDALTQVLQLVQQTGKKGGCSIEQVTTIMDRWKRSQQGKLNEPVSQAVSEAVVRVLSTKGSVATESTLVQARHTRKKSK